MAKNKIKKEINLWLFSIKNWLIFEIKIKWKRKMKNMKIIWKKVIYIIDSISIKKLNFI